MSLTKKVIAVSTIFLSAVGLFAQGKASEYTEKDLVWQENFDGKKVNKKDWNFEYHEPGWVNAELQSYGDSSANTYVKDGNLIIQALKEKKKDGTFSYTSGRINTQGKHSFTYGRFEARLKVPTGKGFLPAFWMMPEEESYYGQWPKCGEIDIMEVMGQETNKVYGTIHYGDPHAQVQGTKFVDKAHNFADEYHVFAVEWEPGEIRWYCDGENYKTAKDWFTKKEGFSEVTYPAPFDQPFYIILNVAVGGSWVGYPDDSTSFDPNTDVAKMYVDYVKVYQKKSYNENVEKPKKGPVVAKADNTGNLVSSNKSKWEFMTAEGGVGSVDTDGKSHTISTKNFGTVAHSIQFVQANIPLNKGFKYRYSFDASADSDRTMITTISAPDFNYSRRFDDQKINLTKNKKHFSWDFVMKADDDAHCRVEYNLGAQKSSSGVYISNVRLEKIGEVDMANEKSCLPDGNYIFNGEFQEGKGRLENWTIVNNSKADVSVSKDKVRALKVTSPKGTSADGVVVKQTGLKLEKGMSYSVKFDAYSTDKKATATVKVGNVEKTFPIATVKLDNSIKATKCEFNYVPESNSSTDFELLLGSDGKTVYIDNVSIKENCVVVNGEFNKDFTGWDVYVNEAASCEKSIINDKGNKQVQLKIDNTGNLDWMIQLKQAPCILEKGKTYKISLKAKSDMKRTIMLAMQRDGSNDNNWIAYSDTLKFDLTSEFKDFSWTFTMKNATDEKTIFTISMGAVNGKSINKTHNVVIDSIVVEEVDAK